MIKQTLGRTAPKLHDPEAADRWTWIVIAACTQLRLARPLALDLRPPLERQVPSSRVGSFRLTPLICAGGVSGLGVSSPITGTGPDRDGTARNPPHGPSLTAEPVSYPSVRWLGEPVHLKLGADGSVPVPGTLGIGTKGSRSAPNAAAGTAGWPGWTAATRR